jgi:CBS domain-containing protein
LQENTMTQQIQDIMTTQLHTVQSETTLLEVARTMRDQRIGNVVVTERDGRLRGLVTDRDIVVRAGAAGKPLDKTRVGDICSDQLVQVTPTSTVEEVVQLMRKHAIRRVPVVRDGRAVGIVSIGDLARHRDPGSALAQISSAAPNN